MSESAPQMIADALVLCMTRGMSLSAWGVSGVIDREWEIYKRLAPHYKHIVVVSYTTDQRERGLAESLGASAIFNGSCASPEDHSRTLPSAVSQRLSALGVKACTVKTNQFEGGAEAVAITRALRAAGVHTALIARGGYPWSRFEAWKHGADSSQAARAAAEEGDLCRSADHIIGTTEAMVDGLSWRHGVSRDRFEVIPNYVLTGIAEPKPGPRKRDKPVILAAGRLEKQKRFDMLIHAVALSGVNDRVILRIIGDGALRDDLTAQARREGVEIDLLNAAPHAWLLAEMRACTLFVQCSAFEGHPKTVIEAMHAGACVIVTDTPGLGTVVRDGETGLRVGGREKGLAEAIRKLLDDSEKRHHLGRMARSEAEGEFAIDIVAEAERRAHTHAFLHARLMQQSSRSIAPVRWDPLLLHAALADQTESWRTSINGFARRLPPKERAAFLLSLDDPIYQLQGPAAIEVERQPGGSGIHPKHRLMRYHDFFVDRIEADERVVDLGSGVGALAASIARRAGGGRGAHVVGVEIEPANIAKAQEIAAAQGLADRLTYVRGDITTHRACAPDGSQTFDTVVLSNVLEHIKSRPAMLRQWAQWYSPKRFLIRVPAFDRDWKVPFKKELGVEWRLDDTHELEYTAETLEAELREAGLEITESVIRWGEYWVSARPAPSREAWAAVRMLVFDFDGVMSNNQVLVMQDGTEGVLCNRSDGMGVEMLRKAAAARTPAFDPAFSMLVLSKEVNPVVAARCRKLKMECHQGVDDKLPALQRLAAERGVKREQIAYVGNDVNDVECMSWAGLPIAVADAFPACKAAARVVTTATGGHGAVREVCDNIINAWEVAK